MIKAEYQLEKYRHFINMWLSAKKIRTRENYTKTEVQWAIVQMGEVGAFSILCLLLFSEFLTINFSKCKTVVIKGGKVI